MPTGDKLTFLLEKIESSVGRVSGRSGWASAMNETNYPASQEGLMDFSELNNEGLLLLLFHYVASFHD